MNNQYKAVVFDYGEVLKFSKCENPLITASNITGIDFDELKNTYFKYNHLSNVENIRWIDMFAQVLSKFSLSPEVIEKTLNIIKENKAEYTLNTELINLLPRIKEQGFELAIFSNYTSALRNILVENKLDSLFEKIVVSGEIGFQKPAKEAFLVLFDELNMEPSEVIFIDDSPKSLEGAHSIGYTPILFENNNKLKSDLLELGVVI